MLSEYVARGALEMGIRLPGGAKEKFDTYYRMLIEANRRMNLARMIDDEREAADVHFLDSLAVLADRQLFGDARRVLDVGSGAGFPGIPLSIALPGVRFTLVDSLQKRVLFLREVIAALSLNAVAVHARAEDAAREEDLRGQFDVVTARAVAGLHTLLELTVPFARVGGWVIAYKGPSVRDELVDARNVAAALGGGELVVKRVVIPGRADWEHCLVVVRKMRATPNVYPRKAGEPGRNPL